MFLLRSTFWLAMAYLVIKPTMGFDPNAAADRAMAAGQQVIAAQIATVQCDSLQCLGGKAMLAAISNPLSVDPTMQDSSTVEDAPYPRPRLKRTG